MQDDNKHTSLSDEEILDQARKSGLSYNETIAWMARTTGGHGTQIYSDTDVTAVKRENARSENNKET